MKLNNDGINLIVKWEGGYKVKAYLCPANKWTISAGVTYYPDGKPVKEGDTVTKEQAIYLFLDTVNDFEKGVKKLVGVKLNDNQYSALVSFSYNVGLVKLGTSTLLRKVNASDFTGASNEFIKWKYSNGKALKGLVNRRLEEKELFLKADSKI